MKPDLPQDPQALFDAETARVREVLAKGRSANQLALFDLLVERSKDRRSPKEVEIALALFGDGTTLDANSDSRVRVYVHRLRKRIDEHYFGKTGPCIVIPKGEYRIVLGETEAPGKSPGVLSRFARLIAAHRALSAGLGLIACAGLLLATWQAWPLREERLAGAKDERQALLGTLGGESPPLVVVGDSLLLAETEDQRSVRRMILDPAIRTRDDLGGYLKAHPETFYRFYDFDLNFAPVGSIEAAWKVQDELELPGSQKGPGTGLISASSIGPEMLQSRDLVYVGRLAQLGVLDRYVFAGSRFHLAGYDKLVDDLSGKTFVGQVYSSEQHIPLLDYGYLAVREGPTGHRLIVLAGLGDRGTSAMADFLSAPRELSALRARLGKARQFEALFEIRSQEGRPLERRLITSRPLQ